ENELARYKHAIKSNSRGVWYHVPNIADQNVIDLIKNDTYLDDETYPYTDASWEKAIEILTDSVADGGLGKEIASLEPINYKSSEFATYYNKYSVTGADQELSDTAEFNEVLYTFLQIYDELNGTNYTPATVEELAPGQVARDAIEAAFSYEY